jgi:Nucleotidyltransferase of unknown function (DUF6036)
MDRREIVDALTALAVELESRGVSAEMYIVGGAAIALAFDERRATRDIDAVFEPKALVYEAAAVVGERLGLPGGWLNDAVKGFLAGNDPAAAPVLDLPGLRCLAASPETLLALSLPRASSWNRSSAPRRRPAKGRARPLTGTYSRTNLYL